MGYLLVLGGSMPAGMELITTGIAAPIAHVGMRDSVARCASPPGSCRLVFGL